MALGRLLEPVSRGLTWHIWPGGGSGTSSGWSVRLGQRGLSRDFRGTSSAHAVPWASGSQLSVAISSSSVHLASSFHHEEKRSRWTARFLLITLLSLLSLLACAFVLSASLSPPFAAVLSVSVRAPAELLPSSLLLPTLVPLSTSEAVEKNLTFDELLVKVGGQQKTVIMTFATSNYLDMVDNWAASVKEVGWSSHIVFMAVDEESYSYLIPKWPGQCIPIWDNVTLAGDKHSSWFNSPFFKSLSRLRAGIVLRALQLNVSVLLGDIDAVWRGDPHAYFTGDFDVWAQEDDASTDEQANFGRFKDDKPKRSDGRELCCGFLMFFPTSGSVWLIQKWIDIMQQRLQRGEDMDDQSAFNAACRELQESVRVAVLPTTRFPSGCFFFGRNYTTQPDSCAAGHQVYVRATQKLNATPVVIHANWMVGHDKKVSALRSVGAWADAASGAQKT